MRPPRRLAILLLLTASVARAAGGGAVAGLIAGLADADPAVRQHAIERLVIAQRSGDTATAALRDAARDPRPAVAEAAAALLFAGRWYTPADPPPVKLVLLNYGRLPPAGRADAVASIISHALPDFRRVALRVLTTDPSDEVAWAALEKVEPDAAWEAELTKFDVPRLPPAAVLLLARSKDLRGDTAGAVALLRGVLDRERDRPTTSGQRLVWAVDRVVEADTAAAHYADAAARLREQLARADDQNTSQSDLLDRLLDLHARYGPLPRFAADLRAIGPDVDGRGGMALSILARRGGLPDAADLLADNALRNRPGEDDSLRAARLLEAGKYLWKASQPGPAVRALERVTKIEAVPARFRVVLAYAWLSQLHAEAGEYQQAGDDLQRAIDRQQSPLQVRRNGRDEVWTTEDEQAKVYWYYLLDAQARHDDAAAADQARRIVASGSIDSGLFLDALSAVEKSAAVDEVDAYFERVFVKAKARADAAPPETKAVEMNDLAWLCARADRRLPEAVTWAEAAVKLKPNEAAYLDTLAEAKFRTGAVQEAIDLETKALAGHPEDETFMVQQLERFKNAATTRPAPR